MKTALTALSLLIACASCRIANSVSALNKITRTDIAPTNHAPLKLPFEIVKGHVLVRLTMVENSDTSSAFFIFDTGATSLVTVRYATEHNFTMEKLKAFNLKTPTGNKSNAENATAKNVVILFDQVRVIKPHLLITSASNMLFECRNAAGIIGSDILSRFGFEIDFESRIITLYDKDSVKDLSRSYDIELPFYEKLFQKIPILEDVHIGTFTGDCIWDMGNTGSIQLTFTSDSDKIFRSLITSRENTCYESYGSIRDLKGSNNKRSFYYQFKMDSLSQGNTRFAISGKPVTLRFAEKMTYPGNIGLGVMKDYHMLVDWQKDKIFLKRNQRTSPNTYIAEECYLSYNEHSRTVQVSSVNTRSILYTEGLKAGMDVLEINNRAINGLTRDQSACTIDSMVRNVTHPYTISVNTAGDQWKTFNIK